MEYGRQADAWSWGDDNGESQQNDWNSGWMPNPKVPPPTQNFPNQAHQNPLQNKQPADFFDKSQNSLNYSQDYWSQSNVYQPRSDDRLLNEGVYNNNNGTAEVENKEVAPPDNKFLRNAPSSYHQRGGMDVRGQYLPSQNSNPVQPIMNTFQPVNFDGFQQNSQAFPPVSSQMPQMRQFPPQTQSQKLPQTQQTTQQAPQNPQKMPQQVQPPQVSQQILKMPQNPLQQIPPLPHVQQIPPQPQIQQNLPQPQIQQIAPRPQIQQNPPQPQIQQIPHQLPLQMPPQVPQQITQQPQQIVQRRPQQHTQHPPQQLPQQITQQQPQLITQQQPPPISQQQAHQQIEPMNYQQNLVQQPNSFHGYSNSQVPLQVPEPDTQKSRKNSIPPQDEMYYQQSNHFEPSGSRMPEMSHKRSESLPQNFPESASFEGSQAIRYGSERQSSTSSESLTNNYISNKTSVSISESDEPQEQRSVESPDRIQLNSGPLIPPPSQFEHDQMAFFQNKNYGNFPMAASSPLSAQVPENLERPDEQIDVLTQPMTALTINTDDKNSQVCSLDRNQYLETGHLSTLNDAASNIEILDEGDAPPPGLDRLVTGQVCERVQSDSIQSSLQMELSGNDTRLSTPLSFVGDYEAGQRQSGTEGESEGGSRRTRLVQGQSIGDDTDGREVPGEDDPVPSRVVLGQTGVLTPPIQNTSTPRSDRDEMGRRMVVGERAERDQQPTGNISDDYRQKRRHRHHRADSSFDEDDRDYESDRRNDEFKRREERPRRRREHRSPEYRSDEEYDDRRPYHRRGRTERRPRDYNSPERDYREYRDYRDDHRRYRRYDHYREYDDDYYRENRSRPSSRTGSDYRRNMDYSRSQMQRSYHDHSMNNSYMDFNKYSAYEYYEKMRQTDPVRYAAWYEHYMKERYNNLQQSNNYANDRASVHSGQSTSNQRHNVQTPQIVQERSIRPTDDEYDIRLFATNHIKGKLDGQGRLIVIDPNHPLDGQKATVNLFKLSPPILDSDAEEFFESPGPFIPGVTHRNTVLQYLKRISEKAVRSSEKLLYDLIHLTVKGNGEVNEVDVAELLMNSYKKSEIDERDKSEDVPVEKLPEKEVVAKFRELLQQGNKTEALDWAIDNGAWGHALFLASKMDDRTHNQIMIRFANSIPHNDPLQTLYQLMSGHIPQSSTCCADKKWSDWRPHLAMILGNPTRNPALDRKAIIRLGDSLNAHGRLFASHFCYVTAQVDFTHYKPDAKLVLLGSSPNQEFNKFATCRAIMVTMCYEYGLKLRQRDFNIPTLQLYKLILAMRLIDNGRCKNALQYCEMLANEALQSGRSERSLISDVIDVSSRLKMLDPTLALSGETDNDPEWLYKLKHYYDDLPENHDAGLKISHGISSSTISEVGQESHDMIEAHDNQKYNDPYASYNPNDLTMNHLVPTLPVLSQQIPTDVTKDEQPFQSNFVISQPLQQNSYLPEQPSLDPPNQNSYWENQNLSNQNFTPQNPSVTQPTNNSNNFFKTSEEQLKLNEVAPRSKKPETKAEVKNEEQRSGWFGGIWDKLSMRPKNQMRLPDDSNPSIVWDQEKKRWVNLDGEDDTANSVKPPPRAAELGGSGFNVPNSGPQSAPPATNKYKLQKGKLMKSNYVDVMGGSKENKDGPSSLGNLPPLMPTAPVKNNFFIPAPVEGNDGPTDFITPATSNPTLPDGLPDSNNKQLSRCSSVSSLSREVQYYMSPPSAHSYRPPVQPTAPMMYNPTRFQS